MADLDYPNRYYVIFSVSELSTINYDEILIDSSNTLTRTVDDTKAFVKWEGAMPPSVQALTTKSITYTHDQFLAILQQPEWSERVFVP